MYWTGDFWLNWAAKEALRSWEIYREKGTCPKVEKVEPDPENGLFVVTFTTGDRFEVVPSGIAKPARISRV
jgi:hypothetical protein